MNDNENIKSRLLNKIVDELDEKIASIQAALAAAKESRDNETKCSVGDKYETSRTMMQLEVEKNRVLLNKTLAIKNDIEQIDIRKKFSKVEFGSLVITSQGTYFFTVAMGKIEIENKPYYCISLVSPVGQVLKNKRAGETVKFNGREIKIEEII